MPALLTPDSGLLFWMVVAFAVMFVVLAKFGFPVITKMVKERKGLLEEYARNFGPLTIDCTDMSESERWKWMEQPFPWEREGGCR